MECDDITENNGSKFSVSCTGLSLMLTTYWKPNKFKIIIIILIIKNLIMFILSCRRFFLPCNGKLLYLHYLSVITFFYCIYFHASKTKKPKQFTPRKTDYNHHHHDHHIIISHIIPLYKHSLMIIFQNNYQDHLTITETQTISTIFTTVIITINKTD